MTTYETGLKTREALINVAGKLEGAMPAESITDNFMKLRHCA